MKLSAPVSSIFLLQPCCAYRHDLNETGPLHPRCWFEPTLAMDQRLPDNLKSPALNPLPEESGRPSQKKEGAESKPVHITGQATVVLTEDNRNRKRSRAPCPVGLNQHVLGPAPGYDVRNGRDDETEPKPRDAGRGRAPRGTRPKAKNFGDEGRAQGIPAEPRLRMDPASEKSSPTVDRAVGGHGYPAMQRGATTRAEEDPMIITFTGSRKVGNIACNAAERHRYARSSRNPAQSPVFPSLSSSLFVEPGIDLRHQDRPKGKFPDLRFSRQSAQVAAS